MESSPKHASQLGEFLELFEFLLDVRALGFLEDLNVVCGRFRFHIAELFRPRFLDDRWWFHFWNLNVRVYKENKKRPWHGWTSWRKFPNTPELLSDDVDGRWMLTEGVISDGKRGANGLNFLAGLKKLQNAHLNAAYSYSSWRAIPETSQNSFSSSLLCHTQSRRWSHHYAWSTADRSLRSDWLVHRLSSSRPSCPRRSSQHCWWWDKEFVCLC